VAESDRPLKLVLSDCGKYVQLLGLNDVVLDDTLKPPLYETATIMNKYAKTKFTKIGRKLFYNISEVTRHDDTMMPVRAYFTESVEENYVDIPENTYKKLKKSGVIV
jgi:hypothetical protein